jgi:hypothetical protein
LADQVLLRIACLLMRWLFSLAAVMVRGDRVGLEYSIRPGWWHLPACDHL